MGLKGNRGVEYIRGRRTRSEKSLLLVSLEGKNKTEKEYLNNFRQNKNYTIRYARGNATSPLRLVDSLKKDMKRLEINVEEGDVAACIFDSDTEVSKQVEINNCIRECDGCRVKIIISNPCFEIWYLGHFIMSTRHYNKNEDVILELKKHVPDYEKNRNIYPLISQNTEIAIQNAKYLEKYHLEAGKNFGDMSRNPSTNFYEIVEMLILTEDV